MVNKLLSELAKGTWSSATSYTIGDIVDYDGSSYICISNNSNQTPPNATYWALLASRGDNQFTSEQALDLTDGGNSTLHYHDSDRDRSNHTGVQTASTISDFHTQVSSNSDVSENTTARHSHLNKLLLDTYTQTDADILDAITKKHVAVTVLDSSEINFTIDGQEITADIKADSIEASKLSPAVVASLALADSASQPGHSHTASDISDFATEVENNVEVLANTAARHIHSNKTILDNIQEALTSVLKSNYDSAYTHISNTGNPHNVTANQVGLSNVDNTSDLNKPISTATQSALDGKSATSHNHNLNDLTEKSYNSLTDKPSLGTAAALNSGTSSGNVPVLDGSGKLDIGLLPGVALTDTFVVASEAAMLALSAQTGDVAVRSDVNKSFILKGSSASTLGDWQELLTPTDSVHSVFGRQGTVTAQTNDYTWAQINKATSSLADITTRSHTVLSDIGTNSHAQIDTAIANSSTHIANTSNPHSVTASQVGLGNLTNDAQLKIASNLSDLANPTTARSNLGLGTLSTQNGTFSGGGTLATGGFTLTVPATGTAALLETANVFTEAQTMTTLKLSSSIGAVTANTLDGSDTSFITLAGGGGISSSRGAYVNAFGNEYSAIPHFAGNFIFEAGNVATGDIRFYTAGTQRVHIDNNGNVGIGTTIPSLDVLLEVSSDTRSYKNTTSSTISGNLFHYLDLYNNNATRSLGPFISARKARGTSASPSALLNGDFLGGFAMTGHNGTSMLLNSRALVLAVATEDWTSSNNGNEMRFYTTPNASATITQRMVIANNGNVGIGTTSPSAQLHINQSSASGAKPTLRLHQADLSEEFIRFDTTVGAGNPINTTALGTYYGRVRVWVEGVGAKWLALYNT